MAQENKLVGITLTPEDLQMLDSLMKKTGYVRRASYIRHIIRSEWLRHNPPVGTVTETGAVIFKS